MRCLALAAEWKARGGNASFLTHSDSEALKRRIESTGVEFTPLERPHPDTFDLENTIATLTRIQDKAESGPLTWTVLDGYHFDPAYQKAVRDAGFKLLVVDDMAHFPCYHADIILNQNIYADQLMYNCNKETKLLLGTKYALLRQEFRAWRSWKRTISDTARKILVTIGASDLENVSLEVIEALESVTVPGIEAKVVVGPSNPNLNELKRAAKQSSTNIQILQDVRDMPPLMAWADVAVSAAGSTCYELCHMRVPSVVLIAAENQELLCDSLNAVGAAESLGRHENLSQSVISESLGQLLASKPRRLRMSEAAYRLVDGKGAARIVDALVAHSGGEQR